MIIGVPMECKPQEFRVSLTLCPAWTCWSAPDTAYWCRAAPD